MNQNLSPNAYRALRSLFRFSKFTPEYPELLINTEKKILKEAFNALSSEEILTVVTKYQKYLALENVRFEVEMDNLLQLLKEDSSDLEDWACVE